MPKTPKLLVTRRLPDAVTDRARQGYDALFNEADNPPDPQEVVEAAAGCDAILCCPTEKLRADTIEALPDSVGIIATFSVGYEHLDLAAAKARGLRVTNTPDVLTDATADLTLLCLLGAARRAGRAG